MKRTLPYRIILGALGALLLSGCAAAPQDPATSPSSQEIPDRTAAVSIIGGGDGPTSIFVASKHDLSQLSQAIQWYLSENTPAPSEGPIQTAAYAGLYQQEQDGLTRIYVYYLRGGWDLTAGLALDENSRRESQGFARLDLTLGENGEYQLEELWHVPAPAKEEELSQGFPQWLIEDALKAPDTYRQSLGEQCSQQAQKTAGMFSDAA